MNPFRATIRRAVQRTGYDIHRARDQDPWFAVPRLLAGSATSPTVFDIGANVGQTVTRVKAALPGAEVYAFEPSPGTFATLTDAVAGVPGVHLVNKAVGESEGTLPLLESDHSDMSSFLRPGRHGWGTVQSATEVPVTTVDSIMAEYEVNRIDVLKTDTQGHDLSVLQGASRALESEAVGLVLTELIFSEQYRDLPRFDSILSLLLDHGFAMTGIYSIGKYGERMGWADVLFAHRSLLDG